MTKSTKRYFSVLLSVVFMFAALTGLHAQASMIGTHEVIHEQKLTVDRDALKAILADEAAQEKLVSMGVSAEQVEQRINSLTAEELAYFNTQLDEAPAGSGLLGVLVFFVVLFIITDMLCATNIFKFVNCINK
jgi:Na+-translocating ferredoxin:NAD+ oxidoreductase RnfG subunit